MAQFDYDVFVSYARLNNRDEWVREFSKRLEVELSQRLRNRARIFFDDITIKRNEDYETRIMKASQASKLLLVVGSKSYMKSYWCGIERDNFFGVQPAENFVLALYDDTRLREFYKILPRHRGQKFHDKHGRRFDIKSKKFDQAIHAMAREIGQMLEPVSYSQPLHVHAPAQAADINEGQINQLIAFLQDFDEDPNYESGKLCQAVSIANTFIRGSILCDLQFSPHEHLFKTIIHGLVREMASTEDVHPLPKLVVYLHKLMAGDDDVRTQLKTWFDQACVPAGFDFNKLDVDLPPCPDSTQQFVWMDVAWEQPVPGEEKATSAHAYLRCGHLQYKYAHQAASDQPTQQSGNMIRQFLKQDAAKAHINHVSIVVDPDDFHADWELDEDPEGADLLDLPVTVRCKNGTLKRKCPPTIDATHLIAFPGEEAYSTHAIQTGIFATSQTDSSNCKPCDWLKAYLANAVVGLWTRGPSEDKDALIHGALKDTPLPDVPAMVHKHRMGPPDSFWRRVVLYFNPNIQPLQMETSDEVIGNAMELNGQL